MHLILTLVYDVRWPCYIFIFHWAFFFVTNSIEYFQLCYSKMQNNWYSLNLFLVLTCAVLKLPVAPPSGRTAKCNKLQTHRLPRFPIWLTAVTNISIHTAILQTTGALHCYIILGTFMISEISNNFPQ